MILNKLLRVPRSKTLPGVFPLGNYEFRRGQPLSIGDSITHFWASVKKASPLPGRLLYHLM